MLTRRRVLVGVLAVLSVALLVCVGGSAQYAYRLQNGDDVHVLEPIAVSQPKPRQGPEVVLIGVPWNEEGYCEGQFHPVVRQELDRITVVRVEVRISRDTVEGAPVSAP